MTQVQLSVRRSYFPWLAGASAFLAVALTLGDPGVTIDEPLDVRPGRDYVALLRAHGWEFWTRAEIIDRAYRDNKEHPPLGRWLLGIASTLAEPAETLIRGPDPTGIYVRAGRLAPAFLFGCMTGLVVAAARRWTWDLTNGDRRAADAAGLASGFALIAMPRVWSHAHLGALDAFIAFFWAWAWLRFIETAERARTGVPSNRWFAIAGAVWGLALLTKIHAWLIPPIAAIWAFRRLKAKPAALALAIWTAAGLAVFFVGWPWLWHDPWDRLRSYLATSTDRVAIQVQYFGQVYKDKDVPWHYPWVSFAVAVPVGLLVLGAIGAWGGWRDRAKDARASAILGAIVYLLGIFSLNAPVYDGERLFLAAFPLWAILAGMGFGRIWVRLRDRRSLQVALIGATLAQGFGSISSHPLGLSYYNLLLGGPQGAHRLGMEASYWTDGVDSTLLDWLSARAQPGETIAIAPTLAPGQGKMLTTRELLRKGIVIQDQEAAESADWLIVHRRSAYWSDAVRRRVAARPPDFTRDVDGVWIVGVWRKSAAPR